MKVPTNLRVIRREPGFCRAVIVLLALGIATTCLLLFGASPDTPADLRWDVPSAVAAVGLVCAVALLACLSPMRRALSLPPALVLREE
ncbi:MAG TPA: hypothetical protein VGR48_19610 [Terriglobales bacterium]|nr:hypothetical protein [Terriglobales bacterium]